MRISTLISFLTTVTTTLTSPLSQPDPLVLPPPSFPVPIPTFPLPLPPPPPIPSFPVTDLLPTFSLPLPTFPIPVPSDSLTTFSLTVPDTSIPLPTSTPISDPPTILEIPSTTIKNNCPFPIWAISVGTDVPSSATEVTSLNPFNETQYYSGIGTAIKITRTPDGIYTNNPVLTLAYTYQPDGIYYDLSSHAGFAFDGLTIKLEGKGGDVEWRGSPGPQITKYYGGQTPLVLELCV